jgi:TM2 domain-containing membrane protein YozV
MTAAEYYATYHAPKTRVAYVLLGVFLGALGAHNFYAGYVRKGVAQLCITLLTCFYGSPVSWIWAVYEVCTVHQDNEGVQFT